MGPGLMLIVFCPMNRGSSEAIGSMRHQKV